MIVRARWGTGEEVERRSARRQAVIATDSFQERGVAEAAADPHVRVEPNLRARADERIPEDIGRKPARAVAGGSRVEPIGEAQSDRHATREEPAKADVVEAETHLVGHGPTELIVPEVREEQARAPLEGEPTMVLEAVAGRLGRFCRLRGTRLGERVRRARKRERDDHAIRHARAHHRHAAMIGRGVNRITTQRPARYELAARTFAGRCQM